MTTLDRGDAILFGGRITARAGNGIAGATIEILSRNTRTVLGSTISIEGGSYRIRVVRASIGSRERALTIRALSGDGQILVTRSMPLPAGDESVTDLVVSPDRLKNFRPAAEFLPRHTDSIMNPESLARMESAIRLITPEGGGEHERLARVSRRALPPLARFDSVLQDSWNVLEGDLDAARRLRRALTFLANAGRADSPRISAPPSAREGEFGLRDFAHRAMPTAPLADINEIAFRPDICPAPTARLLPIMAATLRIATGPEDAAMLLDGLDIGLRGLNSFEFLTKLGEAALASGNTAPFADELTRLTVEFGQGGDSDLRDGIDWPFPPPGPPPPQPLEPCGRWTRECFGNLVEDWRLQAGIGRLDLGPVYDITSVTPSDACPGETVVIAGIGFGSIPGQVVFPHQDGVSTITVDPVVGTWTNTSVSAVVPAEAGSGTLRLLIQDGLVTTCEGPLPVFRQGTGGAFVGGIPFVSSVTINGKQTGAVVAPDSQFTVTWNASPSNAQVSVFVFESLPNNAFPKVLLWNAFMPANGTLPLRTSPRTSRGELHAEIWAPVQRCGGPSIVEAVAAIDVPATLKIEGIEVTQGIQVFSLTGPRNTLSTIEDKDTIVRVYVSADTGSSFRPNPIPGVTGSLLIDGTPLYPINGITPNNPGAGNPFITARAAADIDRTQTDHTLNFRIPAVLAKGTKTLVIGVGSLGPPATRLSTTALMPWTWTKIPPLTVRFVLVQDARPSPGPGLFPSESQVRYTLQRAFDLLPSPASNIAPAWHAAHIVTGATNAAVLDDIRTLAFFRALPDPATGTQDKSGWIGLTLASIFTGPGLGATVGLASTAPIYIDQDHQGPFRIVAAHEITHWLMGPCHTDDSVSPCAGSTASNPVGQVIFDPYWNEAVSGTLSYFQSIPSGLARHWIRPVDWDRLSVAIIAWEGRP